MRTRGHQTSTPKRLRVTARSPCTVISMSVWPGFVWWFGVGVVWWVVWCGGVVLGVEAGQDPAGVRGLRPGPQPPVLQALRARGARGACSGSGAGGGLGQGRGLPDGGRVGHHPPAPWCHGPGGHGPHRLHRPLHPLPVHHRGRHPPDPEHQPRRPPQDTPRQTRQQPSSPPPATPQTPTQPSPSGHTQTSTPTTRHPGSNPPPATPRTPPARTTTHTRSHDE